jgi:two-component system LytT family response regulator
MSDALRAILADDEPLARGLLATLLARAGGVEVVAACEDAAAARDAVRRLRPDVLFLDVRMPGEDGLALLASLGDARPPAVVFVTAHDAHAVRAFELEAIDYLLKPFDEARLAATLDRVRRQLAGPELGLSAARLASLALRLGVQRPRTRLAVDEGHGVRLVPVQEVEWLEADDKVVRVHTGRERLRLREGLGAVERGLDPDRFVRVSRSAVVNADHLRSVEPWGGGSYRLVMRSGAAIVSTPAFREGIDRLLGRRLRGT